MRRRPNWLSRSTSSRRRIASSARRCAMIDNRLSVRAVTAITQKVITPCTVVMCSE